MASERAKEVDWVERLLESKAEPLIRRGEAILERAAGPMSTQFNLCPTNARACPFAVEVETEGDILHVRFGRFGMHQEDLIGSDLSGTLDFVEQCIDAVVAGRYRERVCVEGDRTKSVGKLALADRTMTLMHDTLFGWRCRTGWQDVAYEPYAGSRSAQRPEEN